MTAQKYRLATKKQAIKYNFKSISYNHLNVNDIRIQQKIKKTRISRLFCVFILFATSAATTTAAVAVIAETNDKKRYYDDPNKVFVVKKIAKTVHKVLLYGRANANR